MGEKLCMQEKYRAQTNSRNVNFVQQYDQN